MFPHLVFLLLFSTFNNLPKSCEPNLKRREDDEIVSRITQVCKCPNKALLYTQTNIPTQYY